MKFFLYSHHLSVWYCIDIARRNSVLVTHGSSGVNYHDPRKHNHMWVMTKKDFSTNSDEGYNFFVAEQACWKWNFLYLWQYPLYLQFFFSRTKLVLSFTLVYFLNAMTSNAKNSAIKTSSILISNSPINEGLSEVIIVIVSQMIDWIRASL